MPFRFHFTLRIFPPAAALLWLASCLNPHGARMQDIDPLGWSADKAVSVAYENTDTISRREIRAVVRLQRDFAYDYLRFELTTITPNGLRWKDTVAIRTNDHLIDRNHYGEIEQLYRRNVVLNQPGRYLFTFTTLMPDSQTEGVTAVGIHIVPDRD